ncbi:cell division protease FtsH [Sinorhizobium fredii]|uniref:ATP-dependent zinc metalloprotease FtsH 3 n=1 Tax=Sinorhizobium fredii (strain USDA 257) TaxID=1185652 RepID=I3XBU3_SINF2|nr:AAA family ATPase [Sinorhizobium fredii]AFL53349.1 ATP-dependent zinc metalloprotease FtsH 3 [Sinorhizobium fredii USDA 257]
MTYNHLDTAKRPKSSFSLPVAVAKCGVRSILRPFLKKPDACFVAVLLIEDADAVTYYEHAARELLATASPYDEHGYDMFAVTSVTDNDDFASDRNACSKIRSARRAVVFVVTLDGLSSDLALAADYVAKVPRATAVHYMAAASEIGLSGMTTETAAFLTQHCFDDVKMAFRPQRPLLSAVRRLRRQAQLERQPEPVAEATATLRLEDMHGYGQAKDWGLRLAEDIRAWKAREIGWEDVDRGALVYGPPGCGKTSFAKALAASCDVELVLASAARWQAKGHLGDLLKAMRAAFDEARKKSPAILFLDEFDSFGDRDALSDNGNQDYHRQVINGLLECLDPSEGREGIVVVGATNNPSIIDRALLRPGRLETLIEIPLPDVAARVSILRHHLRDHAFGGDLARFVSATRGWSGADIEKLARDARRLSRRRKVALSEDLLLEVMPKRYVLSESELRHTAIHEAGHAIVAVVLACDVLKHVHIDRDAALGVGAQSVGMTVFEPEVGRVKTVSYYDDRIAMLLGGIAAETVVYGCHADGAGGAPSSDLVLASDIATKLERHFGFGEVLSVELGKGDRPLEYLRDRDPELRSLVDARLRTQFDRAVALLSERRQELDHLTEALVEKGHVIGDEVRALLGVKSRNTESASVRT